MSQHGIVVHFVTLKRQFRLRLTSRFTSSQFHKQKKTGNKFSLRLCVDHIEFSPSRMADVRRCNSTTNRSANDAFRFSNALSEETASGNLISFSLVTLEFTEND
jgi:hypothetical protein